MEGSYRAIKSDMIGKVKTGLTKEVVNPKGSTVTHGNRGFSPPDMSFRSYW